MRNLRLVFLALTAGRLPAVTAASIAAPSAVAPVDPIASGLEAYVADARSVVMAIDASVATDQAPALQRLADRAEALVAPFVARFPECGEYLKATQALSASWSRLSLEQIEADYHDDGALPRIENAQDRALCYQMKDLLVHPLTGLRLLQEPELDVKSLRHEIDEVVSHGAALKALVAARAPR
jgi:hypothetical protein